MKSSKQLELYPENIPKAEEGEEKKPPDMLDIKKISEILDKIPKGTPLSIGHLDSILIQINAGRQIKAGLKEIAEAVKNMGFIVEVDDETLEKETTARQNLQRQETLKRLKKRKMTRVEHTLPLGDR